MKTKVLYVEDEAGWRTMVGTFLKLSGYQVLTAPDADSALALAEQPEVGIIILDLNLAGTDASELIGFFKANRPEVQVILYTGIPDAEESFRGFVLKGADQCLQKGHLRELLTAVEAASRRVAMSSVSQPRAVLKAESEALATGRGAMAAACG